MPPDGIHLKEIIRKTVLHQQLSWMHERARDRSGVLEMPESMRAPRAVARTSRATLRNYSVLEREIKMDQQSEQSSSSSREEAKRDQGGASSPSKLARDAAPASKPRTTRLIIIAAIVLVVVVTAAVTFTKRDNAPGSDSVSQTVQPSSENASQAASDIQVLKAYVISDISDSDKVTALVGALELADRGPQIAVDGSSHSMAITYSALDADTVKQAESDGSLDKSLLYNAVASFTCLENLQQVTFAIPDGDTYTFRRSELEQSFGEPLNATNMLTKKSWAEVLRKIETPNFASSLVGLSTDSGKAMAGQSVGGSNGNGQGSAQNSAQATE